MQQRYHVGGAQRNIDVQAYDVRVHDVHRAFQRALQEHDTSKGAGQRALGPLASARAKTESGDGGVALDKVGKVCV